MCKVQGTVMTQFQCSAENKKFDTRNYYNARLNNILCSLSLSHIRPISFAVMPVTPNHSNSMQLRTILYHAIASRICGIPNNTMQYHYKHKPSCKNMQRSIFRWRTGNQVQMFSIKSPSFGPTPEGCYVKFYMLFILGR